MSRFNEILLELPAKDEVPKDRQFIMALARGLELLRAFDPSSGPLGNKDLSERTKIPKPTVSRITYTLSKLGYLEYVDRIDKYQLGSGVLPVGYSYLQNLDIRDQIRPAMQSFAEEFEVSVALGTRDRLSMTYIDVARSEGLASLRLDIGSRTGIEQSAMGMAYLAALSPGEKKYLIEALKERGTEDVSEFEERIARTENEVNTVGFCVLGGKVDRNVIGAAVPLGSPGGMTRFVVNVTATRFQYDMQAFYSVLGPGLHQRVSELQDNILAHKRW